MTNEYRVTDRQDATDTWTGGIEEVKQFIANHWEEQDEEELEEGETLVWDEIMSENGITFERLEELYAGIDYDLEKI